MALRSGVADVKGREGGVRGDLSDLAACCTTRRDRSDCMVAVVTS